MIDILFLLVYLSAQAQAYIPNHHMILSRTSDNHGRGPYLIVQEVVFPGDPDPLTIQETWWVQTESSLRMTAVGKGALKEQFFVACSYDLSRKTCIDGEGQQHSHPLAKLWHEDFFHFRYSKNIKTRLVSLGILPAEALTDKSEQPSRPAPYVRLSRSRGTINYALGTPSAPERSDQPGLWIEQDSFVIRKLRLPGTALVLADDYAKHADGFHLPQKRSYSWEEHSAQAFVVSVKALPRQQATRLLGAQALPKERQKIPEIAPIQEFYSRFR